MDLSFSLRGRPSSQPLFRRNSVYPINNLSGYPLPDTIRAWKRLNCAAEIREINLKVMAKKRPALEDVSEELNRVAALNLDYAPARRQVRLAFMDFQQQLDHCLFKLPPAGIRTQEWYEMNSKGLEIFCKSWLPREDDQIKGVVCFCHGYGDTCTFFFEGIARKIAASGYGVFALDHPGFGLSDGLHGYISNFDDLVDNIIEQYTKIKGRPELRSLPRFLFGQSMGGAVAIKVILREPHQWDGVLLVAPMCKIAEGVMPPPALLKVGALLSKGIPKVKFFQQGNLSEFFLRDLKKRKLADYNVICYTGRVRLKTAMELLKATSEIESQLEKVFSPLLILHGAADKVTDPMVSRFLYEKSSSKDKTLKLYEGAYHCILEGEPDDRISAIFDDIISWLDSRSSSLIHILFNYLLLLRRSVQAGKGGFLCFVNKKDIKEMNHCAIERNGIPSFQEMRNSVSSVTTSISMSGRKESVVCPKPRRMRSYLNHTVNDPARSLRLHFSYHAEHADSEAGIELLDVIFAKGGRGSDRSSTQIASSPPFFCGSPPSRVSNPLIQDARFKEENFHPISSLQTPILAPLELASSPTSKRKGGGGGCVRESFGSNPAVRIEGFDCLDRDHRNCSIPTLA
ncbi:hypothetical protein Nepgr_017048 [Nepenthes gracilis]|uniref:Serine aminopeptidase S33 domain-containing protein n=1 Tax=Nepenthes gracilis TaxID=150966 RepID=A0AAD3XRU1_NEPGR|nr:hypothetical protein Nepgr_017048 [Nepenthes gracilis]